MDIQHDTYHDKLINRKIVRAFVVIDGQEYGHETPYQVDYEYASAKQEAESYLLQYLERNKIHARNPGEEADG